MRGYQQAAKHHAENTGLPYNILKLKKDGDFAEVRVLQPETEWVSLFMHQMFNQKLPATRCASDKEKDISLCALCAQDAPRSLRTYIPVRVRGEDDLEKVHVIEYGRDNLAEVINQIEELPEGTDITQFDFKVKRKGTGVDTKYKWVLVSSQPEDLSAGHKALKVPDMEELIPVPDRGQIDIRADQYYKASSAAPVVAKEAKSRF